MNSQHNNKMNLKLAGVLALFALGVEAASTANLIPRMEELMAPTNSTAEMRRADTACPSGYQKAGWTTYASYPCCCKENDNYDELCDTDECDNYSGCSYQGTFAYSDDLTEKEVAKKAIIAFFAKTGNSDYDSHYMEVHDPVSGKSATVQAIDTCADSDCDNCCTQNSRGDGFLVDMEINTLRDYFKSTLEEGETLGKEYTPRDYICWKDLSTPAPTAAQG